MSFQFRIDTISCLVLLWLQPVHDLVVRTWNVHFVSCFKQFFGNVSFVSCFKQCFGNVNFVSCFKQCFGNVKFVSCFKQCFGSIAVSPSFSSVQALHSPSIAQCKQCASMQQPAKTPLCFQTPEFSRQASVLRLQAWVPGLLQASVPGFFQPSVDCGTICTSSSRCLFFFQGDATITASIGNTLSNPAASFAKPPCLSSPLHDQSIWTLVATFVIQCNPF